MSGFLVNFGTDNTNKFDSYEIVICGIFIYTVRSLCLITQNDGLTAGSIKTSHIHHDYSCPNIREITSMSLIRYAQTVRSPLKNFVELKCPKPKAR